MTEMPIVPAPTPAKLKLRKMIIKDLGLRTDKARDIKGGRTSCAGISCVSNYS